MALSKPILCHTYEPEQDLFYHIVNKICQILRSKQPNCISEAHYMLLENMLDVLISKKDARKWELFSLLGFTFVEITRCKHSSYLPREELGTQHPTLKAQNTIVRYFKCMLKFSTVEIAASIDFSTILLKEKTTAPLARPREGKKLNGFCKCFTSR